MNASIIVPAFNEEKRIETCIKSLLNQSFLEPFEIIVVDDGSTDKTKEVVKKFSKVKYFYQKNKGPATARNLGALKAHGEIIIFTDADCEADKNMLKELLKPFKDKKIIGVQGTYKTKQKSLIANFIQLEIEDRYNLMKKNKFIDFIGSYCCAYRKKEFMQVKGFDESYPIASGEDPDLSFKLAKKGAKLIFNPLAMVFHFHPTSLWKYIKVKFFRAFWRVKLYKNFKEKIVKDSYTPQLMKIQILLGYLIPLFLIFSIIYLPLIMIVFILFTALFLSFIPFTLFALQKNFLVALISPFMLFIRTIAFCTGLITGYLKAN